MTSPPYPGRPALALRIGISGARNLDATQLPRLSGQLHAVLLAARQQMLELIEQDPAVRAAYLGKPGEPLQPALRFISPLARGADRLAARAALALGYTLHVPMPFPQTEYEQDFDTPDDLAEFRSLLAQAGEERLALDGEHGPEANRSYEAVGRYVVRHCDVLVAVWDGGAGSGRGGTADIVRYAAAAGVPVWWLHATEERAPLWIADILDLRFPRPQPAEPEAALRIYLKAIIPPPPPCHRHRHGFLGWLSGLGQDHTVSPETAHFSEQERKRRGPWRAYAMLIRWTSGLNPPWTAPRKPEGRVASYWFDRYRPADARAADYAARYRSAYVWGFLLGTLALIFGASALVASLSTPSTLWSDRVTLGFALAELMMLGLMLALVLLGMRRDWHERSIEYRLLAELCRKQQALAPLGWALPIMAVRRTAILDRPAPDRAAWVAWLFAAEQRAAPLPCGQLAQAAQGRPRAAVLEELIAEQRQYHKDRGAMAAKASHTLEQFGGILFGIVILCVIAKLLLADVADLPRSAIPFGFLATVLPAVSAAFVGIRAYAELQLLADQSHHMAAELDRAHQRVERLETTRPLVSQDLGAEAAAVATLMLQDLEGWARLFRVKGIEAG
jgi:hypothetical protein